MTRVLHGPENLQDQGIGPHQTASANQAIEALLSDANVSGQVDLILTYRHGHPGPASEGHYEVWSQKGCVQFRRWLDDEGLSFEVVKIAGRNPLENQDPYALNSVEKEKNAAHASGFDPHDPARRFIGAEYQSYPFAYERVAQLFDSPHAPDLALSPMDWTFGAQPGTHGGLQVRQCRSPLWFVGPGVKPGQYREAARAVDIAPTALKALHFPLINGRDASGRTSEERQTTPDVYLARQDGKPLDSILDEEAQAPDALYLFLLDGLHPTELDEWLSDDTAKLPALRRLRESAAIMESGSIVNFPSITWPSHTTIATGAWCGHHGVVNPSYYLRDERKMVSPQGEQIGTEHYASPDVESLYEAFSRVRGSDHTTAAIHAPFGRGATHAVLEHRNLCDKKTLKASTPLYAQDEDPRWREEAEPGIVNESILDSRGLAQIEQLFGRDDLKAPDFVFHELVLTDGVGHAYGPHSEGSRAALEESDRRIGRVLDLLEESGRLKRTLFVITSDHGMAPQDAELAANPGRHLHQIGMQAEISDIMIWLNDVRVEVERAGDGRTGRVSVRSGSADTAGEYPPLLGVSISVNQISTNESPQPLAHGTTNTTGIFGFSTPADIPSREIEIHVEASEHNPQRLCLDGKTPTGSLTKILYSEA